MNKKIRYIVIAALIAVLTFSLFGCGGNGDNTVAVESVTINGESTLTLNQEAIYTATVNPNNASDKTVTWSVVSGGTATATINPSSGLFKATTAGTVTISATAGGKSGNKTITVNPETPQTPVNSHISKVVAAYAPDGLTGAELAEQERQYGVIADYIYDCLFSIYGEDNFIEKNTVPISTTATIELMLRDRDYLAESEGIALQSFESGGIVGAYKIKAQTQVSYNDKILNKLSKKYIFDQIKTNQDNKFGLYLYQVDEIRNTILDVIADDIIADYNLLNTNENYSRTNPLNKNVIITPSQDIMGIGNTLNTDSILVGDINTRLYGFQDHVDRISRRTSFFINTTLEVNLIDAINNAISNNVMISLKNNNFGNFRNYAGIIENTFYKLKEKLKDPEFLGITGGQDFDGSGLLVKPILKTDTYTVGGNETDGFYLINSENQNIGTTLPSKAYIAIAYEFDNAENKADVPVWFGGADISLNGGGALDYGFSITYAGATTIAINNAKYSGTVDGGAIELALDPADAPRLSTRITNAGNLVNTIEAVSSGGDFVFRATGTGVNDILILNFIPNAATEQFEVLNVLNLTLLSSDPR